MSRKRKGNQRSRNLNTTKSPQIHREKQNGKAEERKDSEGMPSLVEELDTSTKLKALEVRLQGIRDVAKRTRFSFIVLIIASCAIFIAVFNGHFSWNRKIAFPSDMGDCLDTVKKYNQEELRTCIDKQFQTICNKSPNLPSCKEKNQESLDKAFDEKENEKATKLKDKIESPALGTKDFPRSRENTNANVNTNTSPSGSTLSLDEYNRRNLAMEWLKSTNVSIGLLGVVVNSNDLILLGSITLTVMSFWFVFNIRRENRAIVGLLKDIRDLTEFDYPGKKFDLKNDKILIAHWAYHEVVHTLTFVSIAKDYPLSSEHIFPEDEKYSIKKTDKIVRIIIYFSRLFGLFLLLFLPSLVIFFIFLADLKSMNMSTAFQEEFPLIQGSISDYFNGIYVNRMRSAAICFFITTPICFVAYILQQKTTYAIYIFAEKLNNEVTLETWFRDLDERISLSFVMFALLFILASLYYFLK